VLSVDSAARGWSIARRIALAASLAAALGCVHEVKPRPKSTLPPGKVAVLGEVGAAGLYDWFPGMTVVDAIRKAGGLTPAARTAEATLTRGAPGLTATVPLRLDQIAAGTLPDFPIEEGDVIAIP
jgi:hypothetical protein